MSDVTENASDENCDVFEGVPQGDLFPRDELHKLSLVLMKGVKTELIFQLCTTVVLSKHARSEDRVFRNSHGFTLLRKIVIVRSFCLSVPRSQIEKPFKQDITYNESYFFLP